MKKKWFFVILILVVVGVVLAIVFINLFKTHDTKELALKVHEVATTGYLNLNDDSKENKQNVEDNNMIADYLNSLSINQDLSQEERSAISNYAQAYVAFETVIDFFDRHVIFIDVTDTYQGKFKGVERSLDAAQKAADSLKIYIKNNSPTVSGSNYWEASTWADCHGYVEQFVASTLDAFNDLADIYMTSMPKVENLGLWNNDFSDIVLTEMKSLNTQIKEKRADVGSKLKTFVQAYLTETGENLILKYQYSNQDKKEEVLGIKESGENATKYNDFIAGRFSL